MSQLVPQSQAAKDFGALIQSPAMLAQLKMALPKHVTPDRLARIILTQVRTIPRLLECSKESMLGSVLQCAQLGLEPGVNGECWILPYRNKGKLTATFVLGYRGAVQLGYRSGMIASIHARAVFTGDHFVYDFGANQLEHQPCGEIDPDKLTHAWCAVHTANGGRCWDVMTRDEIERIRSRSPSGDVGPWKTDYVEMCRKTVLKRTMKLAPCSAELNRAFALDEAADRGIAQGIDFDLPELPPGEACPECGHSPCSPECSLQGEKPPE